MKSVRIGLFVTVTFAVLSHGAVEPWARAILECASGLLLVMWALQFFFAEEASEIVLPQLLFPMAKPVNTEQLLSALRMWLHR
jgi:hypothetical protein